MRYRSYRTPVPGCPYQYALLPGAGSPVPGTGDLDNRYQSNGRGAYPPVVAHMPGAP
jgi:hypothetical protein